jgi:hypothetical protein
MSPERNAPTLIPWILLLIMTSGCDDERTTQVAREAADRQAQQNTAMAELNKEVASGTRQLVEADAQARKEIVGVHRELQAERTRLDTSWNDLELERKHIASQRRTESMLKPVVTLVGGILVVFMLLSFCWHALVASRRSEDLDAELSELLVSEILPDQAVLFAGDEQPRLLHQPGTNDGEAN